MIQRIWVVLIIALLSTSCASTNKTRFEFTKDYQALGIEQDVSYTDYQTSVAKVLQDNWTDLIQHDYPDLEASDVKRLIEAHTPTDKSPVKSKCDRSKPRGMLLVHGLYDSPYVMKDLEEYFRDKCFHTRSILLPGHGTRPGSLLNIQYTEWVKVVDQTVEQFATDIGGKIYMTGFSTGAALALKNALDAKQVKGLFLFAPALQVEDGLARLLDNLGLDWVPTQRLKDKDLIKYESITLDSVIAVGDLADDVRKKLGDRSTQLDIPVMVVIAENDYTIKTQTTIELFEQGRFGAKSDMMIYAPIVVGGKCFKGMLKGDPTSIPKIPTYIGSCFVHEQDNRKYMIADYSHMALTLKSTDEHYGLEGDYKYCTQYFYDEELEALCKREQSTMADICFGERRKFGSADYPECNKRGLMVRRLTSNPQFKKMTDYMDQFIERYIEKGF